MKMKNKYIVSSLALALLFGCVPDSRDFNMPDSAVYFTDNAENKGVQEVLMYDVQTEVEVPVYVHCSGLNSSNATVSAAVNEEYIAFYNEAKYTELKALPQDCFTLEKSSDALVDRSAEFKIKFNVANIVALSKQEGVNIDDYVVSLGLDSDDVQVATVKENSLGYYLIRPDLREATARVTSTGLDAERKMTITVELPFDNKWDFEYEIEFGKTDVLNDEAHLQTSRGNLFPAKYVWAELPEGTVIENKEVKTMAPGVNKVEYVITIPEVEWESHTAYNYAFEVSGAKLNGKNITVENGFVSCSLENGVMEAIQVPYTVNHSWYHAEGFLNDEADHYRKKLEPYGLVAYPEAEHKTYVWSPESTQNGYWREHVFSGNGRHWYAAWNNDGYGVDIALSGKLRSVIDMGKKQDVAGLEMWTRVERNGIGDVQVVEFYALDKCVYKKDTPQIDYDPTDVTYLGTLDFNGKNHLGYLTFDPVNTQYILVHFIEQTRKGSIDVNEIIIYK